MSGLSCFLLDSPSWDSGLLVKMTSLSTLAASQGLERIPQRAAESWPHGGDGGYLLFEDRAPDPQSPSQPEGKSLPSQRPWEVTPSFTGGQRARGKGACGRAHVQRSVSKCTSFLAFLFSFNFSSPKLETGLLLPERVELRVTARWQGAWGVHTTLSPSREARQWRCPPRACRKEH